MLNIFLDIFRDPITEFNIQIFEEQYNETLNSYKVIAKKDDSDDSGFFLNSNQKSENGILLLKTKTLLNKKNKIKYLTQFPELIIKLLKERHKILEFYLKNKKIEEFSLKIFSGFVNEKIIKLNFFKNLFFKIKQNSIKLNEELTKKNAYKRYENEIFFEEPINKLDLEIFWLWIKSKTKRWNKNDIKEYKKFESISEIILFDSKGYEKSIGFDHQLLNNVPASVNKMLAGNIGYDDKLDKYSKITDIIDISGSLETLGEKDISKIKIFLDKY